ncbi:hypothetical protein J4E76_07910 [Fabibacter sp. E12]|nr:hypothetical protein [Roseivirga sp. E12]MBO3698371.1 hypothetical protein [Roseivirga sp. E12]
MNDKSLIIIQARMSSTRMAGKVLRPFYGNMSLLDIQLDKLRTLNIPIALATTLNSADDQLENWGENHALIVYRGSENHVLNRFIDCAEHLGAENLIRICSDNPFLQINEIGGFLEALKGETEYVSLCGADGMPAIRKHWGLFSEGVKLSALKKAKQMLKDDPAEDFYQEHVTNYLYENPEKFKVLLQTAPSSVSDRNDLRFTIDTPGDFKLMQRLYKMIGEENSGFSVNQLVSTSDANPDILKVMSEGISSFSK